MVKLIVGLKGTGKTKLLIEQVNSEANNAKGDVVCIEKGKKLTYDISHRIRLISADEYGIDNFDCLYAFVCGIIASNYDITAIFIDGVLKICGNKKDELAGFVEKLKGVLNDDKTITITVSADPSEISELKEYIA